MCICMCICTCIYLYVYMYMYKSIYTYMHVAFYSFSAAIVFDAMTCICDIEGMEEAEATLEKSKS